LNQIEALDQPVENAQLGGMDYILGVMKNDRLRRTSIGALRHYVSNAPSDVYLYPHG
jgi:hypothetical protein